MQTFKDYHKVTLLSSLLPQMPHCTLVAQKLVSTISQCTCCGGVDNALAAVVWTMHLLWWCGQCTCCGGVDNALAAVVWTMHLLWWCGQCTCCGGVDNALAAVARAARKSWTQIQLSAASG